MELHSAGGSLITAGANLIHAQYASSSVVQLIHIEFLGSQGSVEWQLNF